MKIVTHSGHFHTDDLLAVASLLLIYPEAEVIRTRDEKIIEEADIVVDVGLVYDPVRGRFDHHQKQGAGKRENGIPYASCGLVWKEFGEQIAGSKEEAGLVENKLIAPVDCLDNGIKLSTPLFEDVQEYTLGDYFESFAENIGTLEDYDTIFMKVLILAKDLLRREIKFAKDAVKDWQEVEVIYEQSENKKIIILPRMMHWKKVLIPLETLFVISPRQDGWASRAVPKDIHDFSLKKPFPANWGGLLNDSLAEASGVPDAVFCHRDLWMARAKSKEGAIKLAEIALNY